MGVGPVDFLPVKALDHYAMTERAACGLKSLVAVRHVSGDRSVAMIEIVSPGNKNTANAFRVSSRKSVNY